MAIPRQEESFKRKRNRYRLVIQNDDTYEQVATLRLTRLSVYIFLSTIFLVLTGLTIAVISFTDLRFLIPGYGRQGSLQELRVLKLRADSIEQALRNNDQYYSNLQKVLSGKDNPVVKDTTLLEIPKIDNEYQ
jgi:hypothetical protein